MTEQRLITWDSTLRSFLREAGSAAPTPGGGSVSALVGALGAAMTSMVGRLSEGEKYIAIRPLVTEVLNVMEQLSAQCETLLMEDIESFERYMQALRLPKATEEEKEIRMQALQQAAEAAAQVPVRILEACRDGIRSAARLAEASNKSVVSDLGIGAILFESAAQSALLTIEINLAALQDAEFKERVAGRASALIREITAVKEETLVAVRQRIIG
ncbi:cyclodeaminase/cyclohydrolase family protein [Paenibacillus filicis]|uniref:Cyclodeaminase/cyclohydrolase family protein n=1 Tax=Paenibacillus gyeongsangnamensis TaxID=3388067 RepID=A0ABT4Q6V1_9BACL|nr:cyclodeaminase/cyclohydrolase family protein [Paenibacillus filicis]MCZ8512599.1 cyclodeaminase/cyclohydrolase family protein [Paenibacillus filicis]